MEGKLTQSERRLVEAMRQLDPEVRRLVRKLVRRFGGYTAKAAERKG